MAILFVASERFELKPLSSRLTGLRPLKWPLDYAEEGVWDGKRYLLTANGAGPKLAAQCVEVALRATSMAELSSSKLEAVVSTGLCGAIQSSLEIGDIIEATEVLALERDQRLPCFKVGCGAKFAEGLLVSNDRVATIGDKQKLNSSGALALDMEAAGAGQRAILAGLPFCCIKVVSDRADEEFVIDFNRLRSMDGRFSRGKIIVYALTHPRAIPSLVSLRRRSQQAASALGVFLASCRFQFSDMPSEPNSGDR
jgi:hypothetical protein